MPHDAALVQDVRGWLAKASADLRAAEHDLTASPSLHGDVVFHCQQASEKALKALLAWHDRPFRKTHNLEEIGQQCAEIEPALKGFVDRVAPLTEYAWKFRYPGEAEEPTPKEAMDALRLARDVYDIVLSRLPDEVRPPTR